MGIKEKALILPALYIINKNNSATTSDLIKELTSIFHPTGEDAEILAGRKDTKFSQKVRNLVSHRDNNMMKEFTDFKKGIYTLTVAGKKYLDDNIETMEYMSSNPFDYDDIQKLSLDTIKTKGKKRKKIVYDEKEMVVEGKTIFKETKHKKRCTKLRNAVIQKFTKENGHISCSVCGFDFEEVYKELGKGYIEIHHEVPIYQYSDEGFGQYVEEAVKNMKPLCANCHRMIHRQKNPLSIEELKRIVGKNNE